MSRGVVVAHLEPEHAVALVQNLDMATGVVDGLQDQHAISARHRLQAPKHVIAGGRGLSWGWCRAACTAAPAFGSQRDRNCSDSGRAVRRPAAHRQIRALISADPDVQSDRCSRSEAMDPNAACAS